MKISQHGKGRYQDIIFAEGLWRTVEKYEEASLKAYPSAGEARRELGDYFRFYNNPRLHQALGYQTPVEVYHHPEAPDEELPKGRWLEDPVVTLDSGASGLSLHSVPILSN